MSVERFHRRFVFRPCSTLWTLAALAAPLSCALAQDNFPQRPLRIMVGFSAGSVVDISARVVAEKLSDALKQPVVIDNRPSAGGIVAAELVARGSADGYTLLSVSASHAIGPAVTTKLPYNVLKDFAGITTTVNVPSVLVTSAATGPKTVKDLIALSKAKPGSLNFSSGGIASSTHFVAELFNSMAGIEATHVPFKGIPEALTAVISGTVNYTITPMPNALAQVSASKVNALGVTVAKRTTALPEIPTIAEAGVTGFRYDTWFGLLAPAATPRPLVERLNKEVVRVLNLPEVRERFRSLGAEPIPMGAAEFDTFIAQQVDRFIKVAKQANIRAE
ncbi:MAG: tripartite tricarboxylate transporter substrate binding protein [Proteobacteria bacterium]|nr:tripartite tricarboxylate transporter substrate binding protein [Burkholderiales bacterium]